MRILLALIALAALGWGGYWFVGAAALESAYTAWMEDRRSEGWQADFSDITTRGFPNRFDTTLTGVRLADPETGIAWTAPFFQILSLSYRPNHVIAIWPPAHSLATPHETVEILSDATKGSIVVAPNSLLTLDRAQFVVDGLSMQSTAGWRLGAREVRIATRLAGEGELAHDFAVSATDVEPGGVFAPIAKGLDLPDILREVKVDATVLFSKPWDRLAIEQARPQPRKIDVNIVRAEWGEMLFQVAGTLDVDDTGIPTGNLSLQARNWRAMLALAVETGALPEQAVPSFEKGLKLLAGLSGNPEHIDARLIFRHGLVALGPIPLGEAPRLVIR